MLRVGLLRHTLRYLLVERGSGEASCVSLETARTLHQPPRPVLDHHRRRADLRHRPLKSLFVVI